MILIAAFRNKARVFGPFPVPVSCWSPLEEGEVANVEEDAFDFSPKDASWQLIMASSVCGSGSIELENTP